MTDGQSTRTVTLNFNLSADMTGFGSAAHPTPAHHRLMKHYSSPFLFGPPPSEDLLEMVTHLFTEEEAEVAQHLPPLRSRTPRKIAKVSGLPIADVERALGNLATNKMVILASGDPRKYAILPVVPGTFELVLMTHDLATRNAWHRKFVEIFERIWDTGYIADYPGDIRRAPVRYLPVGGVTKTLYMAWPSDLLEEILEPYDLFAVGHCQCRLAMQMVGKGCGKPTETCTVFGPMAKGLIDRGLMRKSDRSEIIEIKRRAEIEGCVTWMMNENDEKKGNGSCSCCGCCCHALRGITSFNAPGLISRPHFLPVRTAAACKSCRKCVKICPMNAWTLVGDEAVFNKVRCIGCGLCVVSCKSGGLKLEPVSEARPPDGSMTKMILGMTPGYLKNGFRVWARRLFD